MTTPQTTVALADEPRREDARTDMVLRRVSIRAARLGRLAALGAPAIIIENEFACLEKALHALRERDGYDPADMKIPEPEPMTPEEIAELEAEEEAWVRDETEAMRRAGLTKQQWDHLPWDERFERTLAIGMGNKQ